MRIPLVYPSYIWVVKLINMEILIKYTVIITKYLVFKQIKFKLQEKYIFE